MNHSSTYDDIRGRLQLPRLDSNQRPTVCIQGLGFVGAAMAVAVAKARCPKGLPLYNVIGVDLPTPLGLERIAAINSGKLPFETNDEHFKTWLERAHHEGNLIATDAKDVYSLADIVVVDIHCDVVREDGQTSDGASLNLKGLVSSLDNLGKLMKPGSLILVETTVPPGTCEEVLYPLVQRNLKERGLAADDILLAHSYERVMPGDKYLESITDFYRVFSGVTTAAADRTEAFLASIINTKDWPLTRLDCPRASETAKVLENSYRAVNIAFAEEWGRFAEAIGIDLFPVIKAIKMRPTHNNLMRPGFAVGGYCLTKDPLFAHLASKEIFGKPVAFPFCSKAIDTNAAMPLGCLDRLEQELGGLAGKRLLLLGISYLENVGDTRYSGSETFAREAQNRGAVVDFHDPMVTEWPEMSVVVAQDYPKGSYDAAVFAVAHREYQSEVIPLNHGGEPLLIFDTNNVLNHHLRQAYRQAGYQVISVGRGANCE